MSAADAINPIEARIEQWRVALRRKGVHSFDVEDLEDRLRAQAATLGSAGLSNEEAFLVATRRIGELDRHTRAIAHEDSERIWKQFEATSPGPAPPRPRARREAIVAFGLAIIAAIAVKVPELFGLSLDADAAFYARNMSLFVLPLLAGYFAWKRELAPATRGALIAAFVLAAILANVYSSSLDGTLDVLIAIHLPIALWLAVGIAYAGGRWQEISARMDLVRFSGELFIYYVLIALGGAVLTAVMLGMFAAIGVDMDGFLEHWMLPCGALGAVLVAAWLVESKQGVIENLAPVLTRLFTPLFAVVFIAFLATMAWQGRALEFHRDLLIAFDVLLVLVVCLLLYSISARDPRRRPNALDAMQIGLVTSALLVDAVALMSIASRISELGLTANRVAALGENVILLANLAGSLVLYVRFVRGRGSFAALEKWQTVFLPIYAGWAALVVAAFPAVFR